MPNLVSLGGPRVGHQGARVGSAIVLSPSRGGLPNTLNLTFFGVISVRLSIRIWLYPQSAGRSDKVQ